MTFKSIKIFFDERLDFKKSNEKIFVAQLVELQMIQQSKKSKKL